MNQSAQSRREQLVLFARNFFKHPRMLGSVIPSSRFLIEELLGKVDWDRAKVIVEYGPGVGNITAEILRRMRPDARLVVIEMNSDFVRYLREALPDARLHVVHGSAADVGKVLGSLGHTHANYVVSGIPFSTMPEDVREAILRSTHDALDTDGAFLVYQFSGRVLPYLKQFFGRVHEDFELLNILPARLFFCYR